MGRASTFRAERWLDGDDDRPAYAYFPFGGGPRRCLSMWFARIEGQLALRIWASASSSTC